MKYRKKIGLLVLLTITYCSVSPTSRESISITATTINTAPTVQSEYRTAWLEKTRLITKENRYFGNIDIFGGGKLDLFFWFVDGNLYDAFSQIESGFPLYYLLTEANRLEYSFIDANTAIVYIPESAGGAKLKDTLYVIHISNNTIYRTKDSLQGFGNFNSWNKTTIPSQELIPIAKLNVP